MFVKFVLFFVLFFRYLLKIFHFFYNLSKILFNKVFALAKKFIPLFNKFLRGFCEIVFRFLIVLSLVMAYSTLHVKNILIPLGLKGLLFIQLVKLFHILTPGMGWAIDLMLTRFLFYSLGFVLCYVIMEIFVIWFLKGVTLYYKALIIQSDPFGYNKHPILKFRDEGFYLSSDEILNQTYDDELIQTLTIKYVKTQEYKENSLYTIDDDFLFSDDLDEQAISIALFIITLKGITENSPGLVHQIEQGFAFKIKLDIMITDLEKISTLSEFEKFGLDKYEILNSYEKVQVMQTIRKDIALRTKYNKFFDESIKNSLQQLVNNSKEEVNNSLQKVNNSKEEVNNSLQKVNNSKEEVNNSKEEVNNSKEEVKDL